MMSESRKSVLKGNVRPAQGLGSSQTMPLWERAYRRAIEEGDEATPLHWAIVLDALRAGELGPLGMYLDHAHGSIAPLVSQELVRMIVGRGKNYVLKTQKNPKLENREHTSSQKIAEIDLIHKIAFYIASHGLCCVIARGGFLRGI